MFDFLIGLISSKGEAGAPAFHIKAAELNGTNEYLVNTTDQTIGVANAFSAQVFCEPDATGNQGVLLDIAATAGNANRILFQITAANVFDIQLFDSGGSVFKRYTWGSISATKTAGGFSWNGTNLLTYQDGVEDASPTKTTDNAGTMTDTNRDYAIGATITGGASFDGEICRGDLWNAALPANAFSSLWGSGTGFQLDTRNSSGNYTQTANLKHQHAIYKTEGDAGEDFVSSGGITLTDQNMTPGVNRVDF